MKKLLFLCFSVLLFLSCDMFNKDIIEYLEYYTNTAGIALVRYDGDYPVSKSMTNLPSTSGDKEVLLVLRNPQEYELEIGVEWDEDFISVLKRTPILVNDYTINQTEPSIITLTFLESFLQEIDTSTVDGIEEVCLKVLLTESITGREFESFDFDVMINTPPTIPDPAALVVSEDVDAEWVLAFNVLSPSARKGVHNDIVSVNINNTNYDIEINSDGTFDLDGPFTTSAPSAPYADSLGQSFAHTSGSTVYFDTDIPRDTPTSYTISFTDKNGVTSSVASVTSEGNKVTDFYVSETAASDGSGSLSNPYSTVQSAVDAIKTLNAINPGADTYTIYIKGTITQQGTANSKGMVVIDSEKPLNITIQNWTGSTATIDAGARFDSETGIISISGLGKRVLYISGAETNVTLNNIIITGGRIFSGNGKAGSSGVTDGDNHGGDGGLGGNALGGGVYLDSGTLIVKNSSKICYNIIKGGVGGSGGNAAPDERGHGGWAGGGGRGGDAHGGGVYIATTSGHLVIESLSKIIENLAVGGQGGNGGNSGEGGRYGYGGSGGDAMGGGVYVKNGSVEGAERVMENEVIRGEVGSNGTWDYSPGNERVPGTPGSAPLQYAQIYPN